jgi:hypothetical protein
MFRNSVELSVLPAGDWQRSSLNIGQTGLESFLWVVTAWKSTAREEDIYEQETH